MAMFNIYIKLSEDTPSATLIFCNHWFSGVLDLIVCMHENAPVWDFLSLQEEDPPFTVSGCL